VKGRATLSELAVSNGDRAKGCKVERNKGRGEGRECQEMVVQRAIAPSSSATCSSDARQRASKIPPIITPEEKKKKILHATFKILFHHVFTLQSTVLQTCPSLKKGF